MKRLLPLLLALLTAFAPASGRLPRALAEENDLTVLVYLCGSDLETENGQATDDIREMVSSGIGGSGRVSVLLATGGASEWQRYGISDRSVQYYRLGASGPELLKDAGRRSMGDAATLSGFLSWGLSAAPAERVILILWDHGGGPVFGLCTDQNFSDDSLTLSELRAGLADGLNGRKLDIVGFDCCLMNCLDVCADLTGVADYAVLSQEMVSGTGLDYDAWMKPLAENPSLSSEQIAVSMAETYVAENSRGRDAGTATMSVISTAMMPAVTAAAEAFCASLAGEVESNLSGVVRLRAKLTSFGEFMDSDASDLVDVESMCDVFSALLPDECAALKQAAREAVVFNRVTDDIASFAHGLSFFLPYATVSGDSREILGHYGAESGSYAALAVSMTGRVSSAGDGMTASSYTPSSFYYHDDYLGRDERGFRIRLERLFVRLRHLGRPAGRYLRRRADASALRGQYLGRPYGGSDGSPRLDARPRLRLRGGERHLGRASEHGRGLLSARGGEPERAGGNQRGGLRGKRPGNGRLLLFIRRPEFPDRLFGPAEQNGSGPPVRRGRRAQRPGG